MSKILLLERKLSKVLISRRIVASVKLAGWLDK
jgi:hypothetical protein